ncbi:MAG: hypothetical protein ACK5NG_00340 [Chthoniobacterales bacterium]
MAMTIPNNTIYFRVNEIINVNAALDNTAYAAFDSFSLIPEPTVTSLVSIFALGLLGKQVRRKHGGQDGWAFRGN